MFGEYKGGNMSLLPQQVGDSNSGLEQEDINRILPYSFAPDG